MPGRQAGRQTDRRYLELSSWQIGFDCSLSTCFFLQVGRLFLGNFVSFSSPLPWCQSPLQNIQFFFQSVCKTYWGPLFSSKCLCIESAGFIWLPPHLWSEIWPSINWLWSYGKEQLHSASNTFCVRFVFWKIWQKCETRLKTNHCATFGW